MCVAQEQSSRVFALGAWTWSPTSLAHSISSRRRSSCQGQATGKTYLKPLLGASSFCSVRIPHSRMHVDMILFSRLNVSRGLQHKRQLAPRAAPVMGDWEYAMAPRHRRWNSPRLRTPRRTREPTLVPTPIYKSGGNIYL